MFTFASFVEDPKLLLIVPSAHVDTGAGRERSTMSGTQLPATASEAQLPPASVAPLTVEDRLPIADTTSDELSIVDVAHHEYNLRFFKRWKIGSKLKPEHHGKSDEARALQFLKRCD